MWLKSHHWVDQPYTRTERRKVLNVRESSHTVMLFDRKYYNVETGKYDTDKLTTIASFDWDDIIPDNHGCPDIRHIVVPHVHKVEKWFTPRDDDFDKPEVKVKLEEPVKVELQPISNIETRDYSLLLANAERRTSYNSIVQRVSNVRPNRWIPK